MHLQAPAAHIKLLSQRFGLKVQAAKLRMQVVAASSYESMAAHRMKAVEASTSVNA